ncbi:MAG: glycosyltransferase [Anaerolineae bacterium]|nr:glycosyltransferase [Anaerolineae bacterium]
MRILFLSPYLPSMIRVRPYHWVRTLARRGHEVTLVALQPPGDDAGALEELRAVCEAVYLVPHTRWRTLWNGLRALPTSQPLQYAYSHSPEGVRLVQRLSAETHFDVVHIEHLRGAALSAGVNGAPVVYDAVDSITLLFERVLDDPPTLKSRLMARLDLGRTRRFEGSLADRFDRVLVTSPADRDKLVALAGRDLGARCVVVPNGVDLDYFHCAPPHERDPATIVFTGKMSYHANVAAALDLAGRVMPLVWAGAPEARLIVAGKDPAPAVQALAADPRVTVTGTVPDLRPFLARGTISVSAIRYGVGIQNKVLEAMATGTPVVCTPQACSALAVTPGRDLLTGESPDALARHVLDLLAAPERRVELGMAGRRFVENHHSWDAKTAALEDIYAEAMADNDDAH